MTMLSTEPETDLALMREERRERHLAQITKYAVYLEVVGLGFVIPLLRIAVGDSVRPQMTALWQGLVIPLLGIAAFLFAWGILAPQVQTSLGEIPGPTAVAEQLGVLIEDHLNEREKADAFYARQDDRNEAFAAAGQDERIKYRSYTGKPTFLDQIFTSLQTVILGFLAATFFAVPLGIMCGLSPVVNSALNPLIQIFKPVSPLAWLPIVTMIVSALYAGGDGFWSKSMLISALTVTLCSLWPTLINTALGVASIDRDLINVGKVLQLSQLTTIRKVVLPSALPLIFTGLRLSLGVGWMVLIAAEMLAQNPGLGKFVWDEFQNGSSDSLARIMVAVVIIGLIGFFLDRVMYALQAAFTFSAQR